MSFRLFSKLFSLVLLYFLSVLLSVYYFLNVDVVDCRDIARQTIACAEHKRRGSSGVIAVLMMEDKVNWQVFC